MRWWLFIDESGDPDDDLDVAVVGGFLVAQARGNGNLALLGRRLEAALRRAAPDAPWPVHAWLTRRPALYALWPAARGERDALIDAALAAMRGAAEEALERALARLRAGHEPAGADVRDLDRALLARAEPLVRRRLCRAADRTRAALGRVLEGLASESGAAAPRALAFASSAGRPDEAPSAPRGDRWFDLVVAALRRVAHALALAGGRHEVFVLALERDVHCPVLGRRRPLDVSGVSAAAAAATRPDRGLALGPGDVRFVPASVQGFDATTHAGLVAADFLANAARPAFAGDRALAAVALDLAARARVDWCSTPRRLPHAAASGRADRALAMVSGTAGSSAHALARLDDPPPLRRWAREQARAWGEALAEAQRS